MRIESADKKFFGTKFPAFAGTAGVKRVATGFRWAEGPAFSRLGNFLVFSDIPNNRMMRLLWEDNHLSVFREPSNNSNGNTIDPQGRLVTCEHRARRVSRTELDGNGWTIPQARYKTGKGSAYEDLTLAARNAVINMIDLLAERGWSREQAYVICSVAVDLRVSNVVDMPNVVVSAILPEEIFDG